MSIHLFPIRHHGPGSARALLNSLHEVAPDVLLVEGPPDANDLLPWVRHDEMEPPVALLIYRPEEPNHASYFPFAIFSPEWQAIRYGLNNDVPVRFFDLPQAHQLGYKKRPLSPDVAIFKQIAQAAGHRDYEQWWNLFIEQRQDDAETFPGVLALMRAMRSEAEAAAPDPTAEQAAAHRLAQQREAYMRRCLRAARAAGHRRIAVVCGAWHAPALTDLDTVAADDALLHDLPTVEVAAAWVPWTYGRLSLTTGYGAGIHSPGWYHHLWQMGQSGADPTTLSVTWLTRVAGLLRDAGLDASAAHVIEAVRLAEALAALRGLAFPGLPELNEATQTVLCAGSSAPMELIRQQLIVGERMGAVPPETPLVPLQRDLHRQQRALALPPEPEPKQIELDLRDGRDLARSHLLHRLNLLKIPWGQFVPIRGQSGTYQEMWQLAWQPDFAVRIIEASVWGNTVADAAASCAQDAADRAADLPALTALLDRIILADLPQAVGHLMGRIGDEAALSSDVPHMMAALPPLARVLRYGSVRQTERSVVQQVVDGLITRICIGLPSTCAALDDDAAQEMYEHLTAVHTVIGTLQQPAHAQQWHDTLHKLVDQNGLHGLLAGRTCRLLLDGRLFSSDDAAERMARALSPHAWTGRSLEQLTQIAAWVDGFLRGGGLVILHDRQLWRLLDDWLMQLDAERFQMVLPLLRRTFATFSQATRQQMTAQVRQRRAGEDGPETAVAPFDEAQAAAVLPLVARLLGLPDFPADDG